MGPEKPLGGYVGRPICGRPNHKGGKTRDEPLQRKGRTKTVPHRGRAPSSKNVGGRKEEEPPQRNRPGKEREGRIGDLGEEGQI